MPIGMKVDGKSVMIRVGGATIALATSCTLDVTLQTLDARTKSDIGACEVGDYIAFSLSSESVVGKNEHVDIQHTQATLMALMVTKQPVYVEVMLAANSSQMVPGIDWQPGIMTRRGFRSYGGHALIKQIALNGAVGDKAKLTVQLSGQGELRPIAEPELISYVENGTLYVNGPAEVDGTNIELDTVINDNTLEL